MSLEHPIAATLAEREASLNARDSLGRAFQNTRPNSPRYAELDALWGRTCVRLRQSSAVEADAICREVVNQIEAVAALDQRDREAERQTRRRIADENRLFEVRRQNRLAWAARVSASTITAINRTVERLQEVSRSLTGRAENEADVRGYLTDVADALSSMSATLAVEARASVARESEASKTVAA